MIALHGKEPAWSRQHAEWLREYEIPLCLDRIMQVCHTDCQLSPLLIENGERVAVDASFSPRRRGDNLFQ